LFFIIAILQVMLAAKGTGIYAGLAVGALPVLVKDR
jgi:hypothetical protein